MHNQYLKFEMTFKFDMTNGRTIIKYWAHGKERVSRPLSQTCLSLTLRVLRAPNWALDIAARMMVRSACTLKTSFRHTILNSNLKLRNMRTCFKMSF